jgi:hypothetical protein
MAIISIALLMYGKLNATNSKSTTPTVLEEVTESETVTSKEQVYLIPSYDYSFIEKPTTEEMTEPVTEAPTEAPFTGYEFIPLDADIQVQIFTLCEQYEIAYELILAVIKTESEFQWVTGDGGKSIGYMQIQPRWWQATADSHGLDINDPVDNVHLGIIILLKGLSDNNGSLDKALKQYNSGNPNYPGNEYINKVYKNMDWILSNL